MVFLLLSNVFWFFQPQQALHKVIFYPVLSWIRIRIEKAAGIRFRIKWADPQPWSYKFCTQPCDIILVFKLKFLVLPQSQAGEWVQRGPVRNLGHRLGRQWGKEFNQNHSSFVGNISSRKKSHLFQRLDVDAVTTNTVKYQEKCPKKKGTLKNQCCGSRSNLDPYCISNFLDPYLEHGSAQLREGKRDSMDWQKFTV